MSQLPIESLSPEQQQRIIEQMYQLAGKQVQSYHKHRHMGSNTSVPVELAQELIASIEYTIDQTGIAFAGFDVEEALILGQKILEGKISRAKSMLDLVTGTAPNWQTECRWEALRYLGQYLNQYDHKHLAHKGPDHLYYPILISPPEGIRGIDSCLFYLNILWIENQIIAGVPDDVLEEFWNVLPTETLNQCEQLLINSIGKIMIGSDLDSLVFGAGEYRSLMAVMRSSTKGNLMRAAKELCRLLNIGDENARLYVEAIVPLLRAWTGENMRLDGLSNLFI